MFRRDLTPSCGERLVAIQRDLPMFAFLALVDASGNVLCASKPGLRASDGDTPVWLQDAISATDFSVGRYATSPGLDTGFLPFALPVPGLDPEHRRTLVTGLDLSWLAQHLTQVRQTGSRFLANTVLSLTDRDVPSSRARPRMTRTSASTFRRRRCSSSAPRNRASCA